MRKRVFQRAVHFGQRIAGESKVFPGHSRNFGFSTAFAAWWDGLFPPGKSAAYIAKMEAFTDNSMCTLTNAYAEKKTDKQGCLNETGTPLKSLEKIPVWCCWWQGEAHMPELVKMCSRRLQQVIPESTAELHMITLENYQEYVTIPAHMLKKFQEKKITMTTLSDILRFRLLAAYGGLWLDATVYISGKIPESFFQKQYISQKMRNPRDWPREACKGRWCGFFMAGPAHHIIFEYMNEAFSCWWSRYDDIVDYVLIDYLLLAGYKKVPAIREAVDGVEPNNEEIFRMYGCLNEPFSEELYSKLTKDTLFHKLTYKMDLQKETADKKETLYQYLLDQTGMGEYEG